MGEYAGYLAEFYRDREKRLKEEKAILKKWLETLKKLRLVDLKLEDIEKSGIM